MIIIICDIKHLKRTDTLEEVLIVKNQLKKTLKWTIILKKYIVRIK
jgi:hypothetical protein